MAVPRLGIPARGQLYLDQLEPSSHEGNPVCCSCEPPLRNSPCHLDLHCLGLPQFGVKLVQANAGETLKWIMRVFAVMLRPSSRRYHLPEFLLQTRLWEDTVAEHRSASCGSTLAILYTAPPPDGPLSC